MYGCRSEYIYMYIYTHHPLPAYGAGVLLPTWHRPDFFTWSSCRAMTSRLSSNRGDEGSMRPGAAMFVGMGRGFGGPTDRPTWHGPVPAPRTTAERDEP